MVTDARQVSKDKRVGRLVARVKQIEFYEGVFVLGEWRVERNITLDYVQVERFKKELPLHTIHRFQDTVSNRFFL